MAGVVEEIPGADGGCSFLPMGLVGSDDGELRKTEVGHGARGRANIERVAGRDEDDVEAVALGFGEQQPIVEGRDLRLEEETRVAAHGARSFPA